MQLWQLIIKQNRLAIIWLLIASTLSAFAGIGIIAYINESLTQASEFPIPVLLKFIGLLLSLFGLRFVSQFSLTYLGHTFLFDYLNDLIQRILGTDIAIIEKMGSAKILASLSKDIDSIQSAFMSVPSFMQGLILSITAVAYLGYLSLELLVVVIVIIVLIIVMGSFIVKHVYKHFEIIRDADDKIYKSYETILNGRKELSLNRHRAKLVYNNDYKVHAAKIRIHSIKGETLHFTALNWVDVMILASIGIVFFLSNFMGIADNITAMTFAVTILFLQSPLINTIGALPVMLDAQVSFDKIKDLNLEQNEESVFELAIINPDWSKLEFKAICYEYKGDSKTTTFGIGPIDFTIKRGEVIFLIGGNGSGKSTFAKIVTGLYRPTSGTIYVDDILIDDQNNHAYRQYFSAVFTDLHLFNVIIGQEDTLTDSDKAFMQEWLEVLEIHEKINLEDDTGLVLNDDLSQGQKKRLALLMAVMEQRNILLLDEWAADQDPQFRRFFYQSLIPKLKTMGKTLIIISHDDQYFEHADRLLQMQDGRLLELLGQQRLEASKDAVKTIS